MQIQTQVQMRGSKILQSKLSCKSILEPCSLQAIYNSMLKDRSHTRNILLKELIEMCFNNRQNQLVMCRLLNMPYQTGSVSLNPIPTQMFGKSGELKKLIDQVKAVKAESIKEKRYACWVIVDEEDRPLELILLSKVELRRNIGILNSNKNLIGIFVIRQLLKLEAVSACKSRLQDHFEQKTTKTTVTNLTDNTAFTNDSRQRRRKSKGKKDNSIQKVKSMSLKGERKHKSKSNKQLSSTMKSAKNRSSCQLKESPRLQPSSKIGCFQEKILKKKIKEDGKKPALYKKKMELITPWRANR